MTTDDVSVNGAKAWGPSPGSIEVFTGAVSDTVESVVVRHVRMPFVHHPPSGDTFSHEMLSKAATEYLVQLDDQLRGPVGHGRVLPDVWIEWLSKNYSDSEALQWLPVASASDEDSGDEFGILPIESWQMNSVGPDQEIEHYILMATEVVTGRPELDRLSYYHVHVPITVIKTDQNYQLLFRAFTAHVPRLPNLIKAQVLFELRATKDLEDSLTSATSVENFTTQIIDEVSSHLNLELRTFTSLQFFWIAVSGEAELAAIEFTGIGCEKSKCGSLDPAFTFFARFQVKDKQAVLVRADRHELTTHAGNDSPRQGPGWAKVFEHDPPFRPGMGEMDRDPNCNRQSRVSTTATKLDDERQFVQQSMSEELTLAVGDKFKVRNCPLFVDSDPDNGAARTVRLPSGSWPAVRSNDSSALHAYHHASHIFDLLDAFGINYGTFWRAAEREVQIYYRSGMTHGRGRDGNTINARVSVTCPPKRGLPFIEMHLALGNLNMRGRTTLAYWLPKRAEPLGIANSRRWMWHEFAHVLLFAKFGRLEFDFAHSLGDGLAAVACDPFSEFSDPQNATAERRRGQTYVWIEALRRHDRSVYLGWGWYGSLNRPALDAPLELRRGFKGYLTEQILSSTLFRIYRALGGDTLRSDQPLSDVRVRERASLVTQFLAIKALMLAPRDLCAAEALEALMEIADIHAHPFFNPNNARTPPGQHTADRWVGGLANKVVRWAFEVQGMFPPPGTYVRNDVGLPPNIDLYIPDQRWDATSSDIDILGLGRGSYAPTSLDWGDNPSWHAAASTVPDALNRLVVGNRGQSPADGLSLRVWIGTLKLNPSSRDWDMGENIDWVYASGPILLTTVAPVAAGEEVAIDFALPNYPPHTGADPRIVLIEVSCPGDFANSDPSAKLPCAIENTKPNNLPPRVPRQLTDLAACDNNLAVRRLSPTRPVSNEEQSSATA